MSNVQGIAVQRRQLGIQLRMLREAAGLTAEAAAKGLDCSRPKISRIETGKQPVRMPDLQAMFRLYAVGDDVQAALVELARGSRQKGWWQSYSATMPRGFDTYVGLEGDATALNAYCTRLVHGLLQTPDYARGFFRAVGPPASIEHADRLTELRIARQARLTSDPPLHLWVVLEQVVLQRPVGGKAVMRAQLEHLLDAATTQPTVTIQVLPTARGAHAGLDGDFSMLSFGQADTSVVYIEGQGGRVYLDQHPDIERFTLCMDHLRAAALPVEESAAAIAAAAKEMT
jgi:transcriptional regulator with XRE-family HTH domain